MTVMRGAGARRRGAVSAALLATIAATLAGCTGGTVSGRPTLATGYTRSGSSGGSTGSTGAGTATTAGAPIKCSDATGVDGDVVARAITAALQHRSRSAFLTLAGSAARTAMTTWYDNVSAIGFTTGAAQTLPSSNVTATNPAALPVTMLIGLHNAFDESEPEGGGPDTPATQYTLTTDRTRTGNACHVSVTGWSSVSHAPWDSSQHLTVVHTAHTVVAGDPAAAANVRRVAAEAEAAAQWQFALFKKLGRSSDIKLHGFEVFVPSSVAQTEQWFTYATKKPSGWTADVGTAVAGIEFPLPGVDTPPAVDPGSPKVSDVSGVGGGRVVIAPGGLRENSSEQTAVLVHEFTHDIYNNYDTGQFLGKPVNPAIAEGTARFVEAIYRLSPHLGARPPSTMNYLGTTIKAHLSQFNGQLPTQKQIYGQASLADYYYNLSASCFAYLAATRTLDFTFQSIMDAYLNGGGPFSGIVTSVKNGTITFGNPSGYTRAWAAWLRRQV